MVIGRYLGFNQRFVIGNRYEKHDIMLVSMLCKRGGSVALDIIGRIKRRREANKIRKEFKNEGVDLRHMNNAEIIDAYAQINEMKLEMGKANQPTVATQQYGPVEPAKPVSQYGVPPRKKVDGAALEATHEYGPVDTKGGPPIQYDILPPDTTTNYAAMPTAEPNNNDQAMRSPAVQAHPENRTQYQPADTLIKQRGQAAQEQKQHYGVPQQSPGQGQEQQHYSIPQHEGSQQYGSAPRKGQEEPQAQENSAARQQNQVQSKGHHGKLPPPPPPITDPSIFQQLQTNKQENTKLPPPPPTPARRKPVANAYGEAPSLAARTKKDHFKLPTKEEMIKQKQENQDTDKKRPPIPPPRRK
tara:strand:+ start:5757 stop:6827 length:1071 start_codon:yes stop_codon:yes gene_type:complete